MSAQRVYHEIQALVEQYLDPHVSGWTRERITLLGLGILKGQSAAPAQIAQALQQLGVTGASAESLERRMRRLEQDPSVTVAAWVYPWAKAWLAMASPKRSSWCWMPPIRRIGWCS